jgi:predicted nucleic acid-binding protein
MTTYLLDTDILIEFFKKRDPGESLTKELLAKGTVVTSVLTVAEILTGWNEEQAGKVAL